MYNISITSTKKGPKSRPTGRPSNKSSSTNNSPDWGYWFGMKYCVFPYTRTFLHEDGLPYKRKNFL